MAIQAIGITPAALTSGTVDRPAPETRAEPAHAAAVAATAQPVQMEAAVRSVNNFLRQNAEGLEFSIDAESGRTITRLVDKETNTVIRQFPSEEMISIARALDHLQGLLLKQKA